VERLPAYAPELNAVEGAWAQMKNSLGNLAARDVSSSPPSSRAGSSGGVAAWRGLR